jgi:hypothetical protein
MQNTKETKEVDSSPLPQHVILHDTRTGQTLIPQVHFVFDSESLPQDLPEDSTIIIDLQDDGSIKEARTLSDNIQVSSVHAESANDKEKSLHINGVFPLQLTTTSQRSGDHLFKEFATRTEFLRSLINDALVHRLITSEPLANAKHIIQKEKEKWKELDAAFELQWNEGGDFGPTSPEEIAKRLEQQAEQELEAAPKDSDLLSNLELENLSSNHNNTSNSPTSERTGKGELLNAIESESQSFGGEDRGSVTSDDEMTAPEDDTTNDPSEVIPKFEKLSTRVPATPITHSPLFFPRTHEPHRVENLPFAPPISRSPFRIPTVVSQKNFRSSQSNNNHITSDNNNNNSCNNNNGNINNNNNSNRSPPLRNSRGLTPKRLLFGRDDSSVSYHTLQSPPLPTTAEFDHQVRKIVENSVDSLKNQIEDFASAYMNQLKVTDMAMPLTFRPLPHQHLENLHSHLDPQIKQHV